jgi:Fe-S cluster biogenesis protein NfuA
MAENLSLENLEKTLDGIRPYLRQDGGDVELVSITADNIVNVRLLGACNTCPLSLMTLRAGIERVLMNEYPAIVRVENIM